MTRGNRDRGSRRPRWWAGWVLGLAAVVASPGAGHAHVMFAGWFPTQPVAACGSGQAGAAAAPASYAPSPGGVTTAAAVVPAGGTGITPVVVPAVGMTDGGAPGSGIIQANCASCGSGPPGMPPGPGVWGYGKHYGGPACGPEGCGPGGCGDAGCGEAGCYPGRPCCETCEGHTRLGRLFCAVHNALCCPDPCYEPRWNCPQNAALFVDTVRPTTMTKLRWDHGHNLTDPDRSEFFWKAQGRGGPGSVAGGRVVNPVTSVDYDELRLYQEFGTEKFSFYVDMPYRNYRAFPALGGDIGAGGFGDLNLGTKSVLLDSELVLSTFQFVTSIPTGLSGKGIGTGHVSLDPSVLWAIKMYPDTYWQGQLGYWIPISATTVDGSSFGGGVFHFHNSLNHVVARPLKDVAVVGSIESVGYTFTAGRVTDATTGFTRAANDTTYFGIGPGFRVCVCDRVDVGFGMQFAVTSEHFADQLYRTEFRWRF